MPSPETNAAIENARDEERANQLLAYLKDEGYWFVESPSIDSFRENEVIGAHDITLRKNKTHHTRPIDDPEVLRILVALCKSHRDLLSRRAFRIEQNIMLDSFSLK